MLNKIIFNKNPIQIIHNKSQLPIMKRPLLANMLYEPLHRNPFNITSNPFNDLFSNAIDTLKTETKTATVITKTETKTITKTAEPKTITATRTKIETPHISIAESIQETEDIKKPKITIFLDNTKDILEDIFHATKNILKKTAQLPFETYELISNATWNISHNIKRRREHKKYEKINAQRSLESMISKYQYLLGMCSMQAEIPKIKINKLSLKSATKLQKEYEQKVIEQQAVLNKLQETRNIYKKQLDSYKKLFNGDEMQPNFSHYENYITLQLESLQLLLKELSSDIERQQKIINIKKIITEGADGYNDGPGGNGSTSCRLQYLSLIDYSNKSSKKYISNLDKLCNTFFLNSKILDDGLNGFNIITKNFYAKSSVKLKEIFDLQNNKKIKWLERIPKLGIIPKGLRVYEQHSLANCIIKDFKNITKTHIDKEIHKTIKEYQEQYKLLTDYIDRHKDKFDKNTNNYSKIILKKLKNCHEKRIKTYSTIFNNFSTGGCNIKNICNQIKTKGIISLATKAIMTFGTLF